MYNQLFGINKLAPLIFAACDIDVKNIERPRDCVLRKEDECYIVEILTRTGGNNRKCFPNEYLTSHKNYIDDWDDSYDSTYAHYKFNISYGISYVLDLDKIIEKQNRKNLNLKEMFENYFTNMKTEGTKENKQSKQVLDNLTNLIKNGENVNIISMNDLFESEK